MRGLGLDYIELGIRICHHQYLLPLRCLHQYRLRLRNLWDLLNHLHLIRSTVAVLKDSVTNHELVEAGGVVYAAHDDHVLSRELVNVDCGHFKVLILFDVLVLLSDFIQLLLVLVSQLPLVLLAEAQVVHFEAVSDPNVAVAVAGFGLTICFFDLIAVVMVTLALR